MNRSRRSRENLYRMYMEFFERAERKRRWSVFEDIPWELHDPSRNDEERALNVETFCAVELYLPDFVSKGVNLVRECFGQTWFQVNWGYEESKHGLALRLYLENTGQRTTAQLFDLEESIAAKTWELPFHTARRMTCYGAIQESSTLLAYKRLIADSKRHEDELLAAILTLIARDEAAHGEFYRQVLAVELEEDRQAALDDLAYVGLNFRMPVLDLFDDLDARLRALRAHDAFDTWGFRVKIWAPLLKKLDVSREEMQQAYRRVREREREARREQDAEPGDRAANA
ncbi:acyl-ACP desaturase [Paraliomyxa miuraensis]|uniref:acyl-ACP desaturase n=1 Tax=Paraliomyxa miuraensis TaxID=376150 RepID=UPI00225A2691|nr:acyl-ACP desaturase [Paraliomyxa miuraensis]MCX4243000.1 acyl-ACP desaturase [Paraliomyxa miuraensis]